MVPGRKPAFEQLYRDHSTAVYRYCYYLCGRNTAEAQDVAQEALIQAFKGLEAFEGRGAVLAWLLQIARRTWLRRRGQWRTTVPLDWAAEVPDPRLNLESEQVTRVWLADALRRLPTHLHEALILVKGEGLTYREAAEVLGIPQGTVQYHVHEALKITREYLKEVRGVSSVAALVMLLFIPRELQAATAAPSGLAECVYAGIGRPNPPHGTTPAFSTALQRWQESSGTVRWLSLAAALLCLLTPTVPWLQARSTPEAGAGRELDRVLTTMAQVRSARALGVSVSKTPDRSGALYTHRERVEFLFQAPARYASVARNKHGRTRTVIDGDRSAKIAEPVKGKRIYIPGDAKVYLDAMAPFALFTPNAPLIRWERNSGSKISATDANLSGRSVRKYTALSVHQDANLTWSIYSDPVTSRVIRVELNGFRPEPLGRWQSYEIALDNFEYDQPIDEELISVSE